MDWLFDNLGKLAPIVVFLIYMISSLKGRERQEEEVDADAAERARRIQEEIRRKILERQRGQQGSSPAQDRQAPVREEQVREVREVPPFEPVSPPQTYREESWPREAQPEPVAELEEAFADASSAPDAFLEKRREVEAKLAEAKQAKEAAQRKAASIRKKRRSISVTKPGIPARSLRAELGRGLSSPRSLKTSVLLKEVLDKPLGLR